MGWTKCFTRWSLNWSFLHLCFTAVSCSKVCVTSPCRHNLGLLQLSPCLLAVTRMRKCRESRDLLTGEYKQLPLWAVKSWLFCSDVSWALIMIFVPRCWCLIAWLYSAIRCTVQMHISGWQPEAEADKCVSGSWDSLFCCCWVDILCGCSPACHLSVSSLWLRPFKWESETEAVNECDEFRYFCLGWRMLKDGPTLHPNCFYWVNLRGRAYGLI